ncbi:hypothetical protein CYMTET_47687 [Cymbomonas tetramitiformis]|uniref:Uncharacterized protein n=1 Tax=Cymbomonas tetramitiformis TaxID=36881 RepID=A0AAE0BTN1_9CHLO|nr:hypothetical protein CYMTET_47687 [Cymbomonas tetramitiformis]
MNCLLAQSRPLFLTMSLLTSDISHFKEITLEDTSSRTYTYEGSWSPLYAQRKRLTPGPNSSRHLSAYWTFYSSLHEQLDSDFFQPHTSQPGSNSLDLSRYRNALRIQPHGRYFLAVLLHNAVDVAPTLLSEILKVVLLLGSDSNFSNIFVSIYESGSNDLTAFTISAFREHLASLGVPHRVVLQGETRQEYQDRIAYLAHLRNKALQPLFESTLEYDRVVYFNDIYVRAVDVVSLITTSNKESADMSCAVDYQLNEVGNLQYYDIWVGIDLDGRHFRNDLPFLKHEESWKRYRELQPFHTFSCWGGLVVIKAEIFQKLHIRFRNGKALECAASECDLLSRDMWAAGRHKIIVVPSVVTAYEHQSYLHIREELELGKGIGGQIGQQMRQENMVWEMLNPTLTLIPESLQPVKYKPIEQRPAAVECCPLDDVVEEHVDFSHCMDDRVWWWYDMFGIPRATAPGALEASIVTGYGTLDPHRVDAKEVMAHIHRDVSCKSKYGRAIPRRIFQVWKTNQLHKIRGHILLGILSWMHTHPCYEYILLSDKDIDEFIRGEHKQYLRDYRSLQNHGEKADLARYLYMWSYGGVYADVDTVAVQSLDNLLRAEDHIVVGLENDLKEKATMVEWVYARQRGASLHCWAAAKENPVVRSLIKRVIANIRSPEDVYEEIKQRRIGRVGHLETIFKTGPGPFSDALLDPKLPPTAVRVLGLLPFSGDHPTGKEFYNKNRDAALQDTEIFVKHINFGSWLTSSQAMSKAHTMDHLQTHMPMLAGSWLMGPMQLEKLQTSLPVWVSHKGAKGGDERDDDEQASFFLQLESGRKLKTSEGCLAVYRGAGPLVKDPVKTWSACWPAWEELDVLYLILQRDVNLVVYTAVDYSCAATPGERPRKVLWSSSTQVSDHLQMAEMVVSISKQGQLMISALLKSKKLLSNRDGSIQRPVENMQQSRGMKLTENARGYCHDKFTVNVEQDVRTAREAQELCSANQKCASFTWASSQVAGVANQMWICSTLMRMDDSTSIEGWTYGKKLVHTHESMWAVAENVRSYCPEKSVVDRTGRETARNLEDAKEMCAMEDSCISIIYGLPTANDAPHGLWMCMEPVDLIRSDSSFHGFVTATIRGRENTWDPQNTDDTNWRCFIEFHDKAECRATMTEWDRILMRMRSCT